MKAKILFVGWLALILSGMVPGGASAQETFFEKYSNASVEQLNKETEELGAKIEKSFDDKNIEQKQAEIDFAEYYSNFKNLIYFGSRLTAYGTYEEDLKFGKEKEMFKSIPEKSMSAGKKETLERKELVQTKYDKMKENIQAEINTYDDMAKISLDVCRAKAEEAFFIENVVNSTDFKDRIQKYFRSTDFKTYSAKSDVLKAMKPVLAEAIEKQIQIWKAPPQPPDTPIINPAVVNRL